MTQNKFTIGSQWKTRSGHRAVVWLIKGKVFHAITKKYGSKKFRIDGSCFSTPDLDLIEPWTDPLTVTQKMYLVKGEEGFFFCDYCANHTPIAEFTLRYIEEKGVEVVND